MKTILISLAIATTGVAHADSTLGVGSNVRALHSTSANALTSDSLSGGELAYAYHLPLDLIPNLALWGEAAFVSSSAEGTMFQTMSTDVSLYQTTLGAQARYGVYRHVVAFARAGFGLGRESVRLTDSAQHAASDAHWGGVATGSLGVELWALDRPSARFDIGLHFGVGYTAAAKITLAPSPEHPSDDTIRLQMTQASFGALDLSGTSFGGGIVGRF